MYKRQLLADGMITPPISITSAVEGLRNIPSLHFLPDYIIVRIVSVSYTHLDVYKRQV